MSSLDPSASPIAHPAPLTLAVRRPGHALMRHVLTELDREGAVVLPSGLQSWYAGALGELLVGQELARLPPEWRVLHSIPVGDRADVDHLVVGPGGVLVLNTKRHPGKRIRVGEHVVWINGVQQAGYHRNLQQRAGAVSELIAPIVGDRVAAAPLLVFVDVVELSLAGPQRVGAVRASGLVEHLLGRPTVLAPGVVNALIAKLERPRTWGQPSSLLQEPDPTPRFLALPAPVPVAVPPKRLVVHGAPRARSITPSHPRTRPPVTRRTGRSRSAPRTSQLLFGLVLWPAAFLVGLQILGSLVVAMTHR